MTRTLILMRHAKSDWDDPLLSDIDRPLNARGRASAPAIGQWLADRGHVPGEAIVSSARRTQETWNLMAELFPGTAARTDRALYHAAAQTMLSVLKGAREPVTMMIGHNPGIADFAGRLARAPFAHDRFDDYPTAATSVIEFDIADWADAAWGAGEVVDFAVPRDLLES